MKNFFASLVIVLLAFLAGAYLRPLGEVSSVINVATPADGPVGQPSPGSRSGTEAAVTDRAAILSERPAPDVNYTNQELHTIQLFENASPSVCYITTKTRQRSYWNFNVTEVPSGSGSGLRLGRERPHHHELSRNQRRYPGGGGAGRW